MIAERVGFYPGVLVAGETISESAKSVVIMRLFAV
jgi:hypothetical protein